MPDIDRLRFVWQRLREHPQMTAVAAYDQRTPAPSLNRCVD